MRGPLGQARFRGRETICVAAATSAALCLLTANASAQHATSLVPAVTPAREEDLFASHGGPRVEDAVSPLWLTLSSGLFSQANAFHGCESRLDGSGNSVSGFAVQRHGFLRLAPQFVLHRFSIAGCAVDAGSGAGLSFAVPIHHGLWLLHSAGFFRQPLPGGVASPRLTTAARVDLVQQLPLGRTLSVGLGTRSSTDQFHALHLGGRF